MSGRPLEGVRVADFGQYIAGPAIGQLLADLGATVVKVEPVDGEAARTASEYGAAMVRTNNRDKLGLALDLRAPDGGEIGRRLVAASDVVIQNMRPGAMDRLGLGPARATALNPRVVYLSVTAFGAGAPGSRAGLDIAAQAESGMMSVTGEAGGEPQRVGFTVVDEATSYAAAAAILAALFRRERTGEGAVIDTSLLEVAVHLQGPAWLAMFDSGDEPTRKGNGYPTVAPAAEVVAVRDGHIVLSAYTPDHWSRLCRTLGRPELQTDPRFATNEARVANRGAMRTLLSDALAGRSSTEAVEFLGAHGIVAGTVRSYRQVVDGDDARRLELFPHTGSGPDGSYRYPAPPWRIRGAERTPSRPAPAVGQHSRAVLADLGYGAGEIDRLLATGVVRGGRPEGRWHARGPYAVAAATVDAWTTADNEDVAVFAQYPQTGGDGPLPVVVLCHGLGGEHTGYGGLGAHLASHGYAVLHPQFLDSLSLAGPRLGLGRLDERAWLSDAHARSVMHTMLFDPAHWLARVARVHAVLDSLEGQTHLPVALRPDGVVVAGHSFGAYTAQLVLGTRLYEPGLERRVFTHDAVAGGVLMSPQGSGDRGLTEKSWDGVTLPLLVVTATEDRGPHGEGLAWRREPFDNAASPLKHLAVVRGGDHLLGGTPRAEGAAATAGEARLQNALAALVVAFADRVHGDRDAGDWLASGPFGALLEHDHEEAR